MFDVISLQKFLVGDHLVMVIASLLAFPFLVGSNSQDVLGDISSMWDLWRKESGFAIEKFNGHNFRF